LQATSGAHSVRCFAKIQEQEFTMKIRTKVRAGRQCGGDIWV
jgi:hypothetical protein